MTGDGYLFNKWINKIGEPAVQNIHSRKKLRHHPLQAPRGLVALLSHCGMPRLFSGQAEPSLGRAGSAGNMTYLMESRD